MKYAIRLGMLHKANACAQGEGVKAFENTDYVLCELPQAEMGEKRDK